MHVTCSKICFENIIQRNMDWKEAIVNVDSGQLEKKRKQSKYDNDKNLDKNDCSGYRKTWVI